MARKKKDNSRQAPKPELSWSAILELLHSQAPYAHMLDVVLQNAERIAKADAVALFIIDQYNSEPQLVASRGAEGIPSPRLAELQKEKDPHIVYLDIYAMGLHAGALGLSIKTPLDSTQFSLLTQLNLFIGLIVERQRMNKELAEGKSRILELEQFRRLLTEEMDLGEMFQTCCREIALRFEANCSAILLYSEDKQKLHFAGSYGIPPQSIEQPINMGNHALGRSLKVGGLASIPDLSIHREHGLEALQQYRITSAHWCCIENSSNPLGAVLIGFQRRTDLDSPLLQLLEEYAKILAISIGSASDRLQLEIYQEQTESIVEEKTKLLTLECKQAKDANLAKSQFVANMSHELRTPLTAIVGYSSVIARGVFGEINEAQRDALLSVGRAAEHLKDLLTEVLQIAKVEAGKEQCVPAEIDLLNLLNQIHRMMMQSAMAKKIDLHAPEIVGDEQVKIWVDQRHIRQMLINLISNAIKYTEPEGSVSISAEVVGDKAKISITDSGVGIPEPLMKNLFERFTRGEDEYSQSQLGTGLGLALTKQLAEANGGKIGVQSVAGVGSTFWLLLPLSLEQQDSSERSVPELNDEAAAISRLDGLTILIADDSPFTCEVLEAVVSQLGGTPVVAKSVKEAIDLSQKHTIDTALVDLAFPGESGLTLVEYFSGMGRQNAHTVPTAVISACVFDKDRQEALSLGARTFIAKPFDPLEVAKVIRELTTSAVIQSTPKR